MVEILELSVELGDLSGMPTINDTSPWVSQHTTPGGTFIPKGWDDRPINDGWHWTGEALDQGGYGEAELAGFWMDNRDRGIKELIHWDGQRGYLISNYSVLTYGSGWGHRDHVHTAVEYPDALRWVEELRARNDAAQNDNLVEFFV